MVAASADNDLYFVEGSTSGMGGAYRVYGATGNIEAWIAVADRDALLTSAGCYCTCSFDCHRPQLWSWRWPGRVLALQVLRPRDGIPTSCSLKVCLTNGVAHFTRASRLVPVNIVTPNAWVVAASELGSTSARGRIVAILNATTFRDRRRASTRRATLQPMAR